MGRRSPKQSRKTDDKPGAEKSLQEKLDEKMKEAKAKEAAEKAKSEPPRQHRATGRLNVIVVADTDILHDQFWVEVRDFLGQQVAVPNADNATFVVNALEQLAGGSALANLRGRGVVERPFNRVSDLRRAAETQFRQKEEGLVNKLKDLQEKVAKMQAQVVGDGTTGPTSVMLSEADRQTIDKFRSDMISTRRELRDVKAALRSDIDKLETWLWFFNIAAVPIVIGIGGLAVAVMRRRRSPPA